jgi:hypothetical protein
MWPVFYHFEINPLPSICPVLVERDKSFGLEGHDTSQCLTMLEFSGIHSADLDNEHLR